MFEHFNVYGLYVNVQAVLALYESGRMTGVVLDSGEGISDIVPIYEGYAIPHATKKFEIAGGDITTYLKKLLREEGPRFQAPQEVEIIREIKEKMCEVARDYETQIREVEEKDF